MLAVQFAHSQTVNPSAIPLQWLTIASSCWTESVSTACCLCSKVLLSVELPSSPWSWLTSRLCLSRSSWSCCFSPCKPCSSLPYRASSAKSLCSRKLWKTKSKESVAYFAINIFGSKSEDILACQVLRCILNGMGGRRYKRVGAGGESIHSAFAFHSGGCTNLHIYMRMTNRHQRDSLIRLTSYKHLYCSSIHRWACMLSRSIIAMRQQSDNVCVCTSATPPPPNEDHKSLQPDLYGFD